MSQVCIYYVQLQLRLAVVMCGDNAHQYSSMAFQLRKNCNSEKKTIFSVSDKSRESLRVPLLPSPAAHLVPFDLHFQRAIKFTIHLQEMIDECARNGLVCRSHCYNMHSDIQPNGDAASRMPYGVYWAVDTCNAKPTSGIVWNWRSNIEFALALVRTCISWFDSLWCAANTLEVSCSMLKVYLSSSIAVSASLIDWPDLIYVHGFYFVLWQSFARERHFDYMKYPCRISEPGWVCNQFSIVLFSGLKIDRHLVLERAHVTQKTLPASECVPIFTLHTMHSHFCPHIRHSHFILVFPFVDAFVAILFFFWILFQFQ